MYTMFQYAACAFCIALPFMIALSESVKKHLKHKNHSSCSNAMEPFCAEEEYTMIDTVTGQTYLVEPYFERDPLTGQLVYEQEIAYIPLHTVEK